MKIAKFVSLIVFILFSINSFSQVKSTYLETIADSKILVVDGNSTYEITSKEFLNSCLSKININIMNSTEAKEKYGKYGDSSMIEVILNPEPINNTEELIFFKINNKLKLVDKKEIEKLNFNSISSLEIYRGKNAIEKFGLEANHGVKVYTFQS
ncbi:hypothetical protein [Aureivirga marina]|uniref:hypothetical protein n=1 Tax=Aureivirga marina TaxID=1182451 RepID=UPI0018CB0B89|nr:hypothetical protein [Aureivirga marina]